MRSGLDEFLAVGLGFLVIAVVAVLLYRPRIQRSTSYQATVVPLANIMDVGFIILSPAIVLIAGFRAPMVMLAICLVAIAAGFAIAYNIRHYEPIEGSDRNADRIEGTAEWALLLASMVNIAYYALLLTALILLPLEAFTTGRQGVLAAAILAIVILVGVSGGMSRLNRLGDRTTAFNLAAVIGVVVAFAVFNVQEWLGGRWVLGDSPSIDTDGLRKMIGLFAIVQGFEASRYIGVRFGAQERITTMRVAQAISSVVFVVFILSLLVMFLPPSVKSDGTAVFIVSERIGGAMPWLLLVAAIGSQTSAIIGATSSRSDMLVEHKVPRPATFLIILVPAIVLVLVADVTTAVNLASRVFAAYFLIQIALATMLARRQRNLAAVAGFVLIGFVMATILIFGLPL
jgi:hypothetical protein